MFIPLFVTANKEYETTMGLFRIYVFVSAIICFFSCLCVQLSKVLSNEFIIPFCVR